MTGTQLTVKDVEKKRNPIICKSGILMYWEIAQVSGGLWASLIGTNGVRAGKTPWTVVGISFDQETAKHKARERALFVAATK